MKRVLLIAVLIVIGYLAYNKFFANKSNENDGPHDQPLAIGENTNAFNRSFQTMLDSYISLKNALSGNDTAAINKEALGLAQSADSLRTNEIQGDSTGTIKETAEVYKGTIAGSARGLAGEASLDQKQREFEMISDAIWTVTRTVKYNGNKLYYMFCEKAIGGKGAYWVSEQLNSGNPYMPGATEPCVTVQDSLDYSKK